MFKSVSAEKFYKSYGNPVHLGSNAVHRRANAILGRRNVRHSDQDDERSPI